MTDPVEEAGAPPIPETGNAAPQAPEKKQAVVLVHGMGEQIPMETLRGFVETMWVKDDEVGQPDNRVWFKPDRRDDSTELWRVTTRAAKQKPNVPPEQAGTGQRVDFYELYWADLTASTTLDQLNDWFWFLLLRKRKEVPARVLFVWRLLWISALVVLFFAGWQALAAMKFAKPLPGLATAVIAAAVLIYGVVIKVVIAYAGDVARYCRATPANIAGRRQIRARGVTRLKAIAESDEYDRIVLVGHSLGSIVAYDALKLFWADWVNRLSVDRGSDLFDALISCRSAAADLETAVTQKLPQPQVDRAFDVFRAAQAAVFVAAQVDPRPAAENTVGETFRPWLISDFVSLGAALSHAQFLMARNPEEFARGVKERRFPSAPPVADNDVGRSPNAKDYLFYDRRAKAIRIDHGACFSAVRWTNVHDDSEAVILGDIVSGPCAPIFGRGVKDVPIAMERKSWPRRLFTHTLYWTDTRPEPGAPLPAQLRTLRAALNLPRVEPPPI